VVFLIREEVYRELERTGEPIGWRTLFERDSLRLMHAHGATADGLAVTTAAFLAAGMTRGENLGLDPPNPMIADMVESLESKVVEYGPDDSSVIARAVSKEHWLADVVITQEHSVLLAAKKMPHLRGAVVYPADSTIWVDQIIASVAGWDRASDHNAFPLLAEHLHGSEMAERYRAEGFHPISDSIGSVDEVNALVSSHPSTTTGQLQVSNAGTPAMVLPSSNMVGAYAAAWQTVQRPVDVCLVLDISSSMSGDKLEAAKQGIQAFVNKVESPQSAIGLVVFSTEAQPLVPLRRTAQARPEIKAALHGLIPEGWTGCVFLRSTLFLGISVTRRG